MLKWALSILLTISASAFGASPATAPTTQSNSQRAGIEAGLQSIEALLNGGKPRDAVQRLVAIRPQLITLDPRQNRDLYRAAALAWRLAQMASDSDEAGRLVPSLMQTHPDALRAFAFAYSPSHAGNRDPLEVLNTLAQNFPREVDRYANLAAAISLASHPETAGAHEQRMPAPEDLFAFYVRNERKLTISPRNLPPELLVYVADVQAPIEELQWALDRYGKQHNIGARFFDVPYDYANFRDGADKQIDARGYTLPNLLKVGGVCADQAYFASTVAKAMGVPAAVVSGMGPDVGHAWIGYLDSRGRDVFWNLENGRYDAYKGVRGSTTDPQARAVVYEGELRLLSELAHVPENNRLDAIAIADVAGFETFGSVERNGQYSFQSSQLSSNQSSPRQPGIRHSSADEQLLRAAVDLNPACMNAWRQFRRLSPGFDAAQRSAWSDAIYRLCGRKYPDFAATVITPMIAALDDAKSRDEAWQAAGRLYGSNVDVAADIGLAQAENWQMAGEPELALRRCEDVARNCGASGPRVVEAITMAEQILQQTGRQDLIVGLCATAFDRVVVPDAMSRQFIRQTPWYQIGQRYGYWLERSGDEATAAKIARRLQNIAGRDEAGTE